jgi:hypothetical protein
MCSLLQSLHLQAFRRQSGSLLNSLINRRVIDGVSQRSNPFEHHTQKHSQLAGRQFVSGPACRWPKIFTQSNRGETMFRFANSLPHTRVAFELDGRVATHTHTFNERESNRQAVSGAMKDRLRLL